MISILKHTTITQKRVQLMIEKLPLPQLPRIGLSVVMCFRNKKTLKKSRSPFHARSPDSKRLPEWLRGPIRKHARQSRPPLITVLASRKKPVFDWDAWACKQLTRERWSYTGDSGWLSCVQQWAGRRPNECPLLLQSRNDIVRAIVTLTVAETMAYHHGIMFEKLDVNVRRHINTTANRQRSDSVKKVSLFHVVHLALARFDFDTFINRVSESAMDKRLVRECINNAFTTMHNAAKTGNDHQELRNCVVTLTNKMRELMKGYLFVPWNERLFLPISKSFLLENAARSFITGIPRPDVTFLSAPSFSPDSPLLVMWLVELISPFHDSRWDALAKFTKAYSCHPSSLGIHDCHTHVAFYVMTLILSVSSKFLNRDNMLAVAHMQSQKTSQHGKAPVFRDLLDLELEGERASIPIPSFYRVRR